MAFPRWLMPATIRSQMFFVILLAVVTVVTIGDYADLVQDALFPVEDIDTIADRAVMVAELMSEANAQERAWLLERASRTGLDLSLVDPDALQSMIASSPAPRLVDRWVAWLFPPDARLSPGGQWIVIDGRRAIALPIDPQSLLIVRDLPEAIETDDFTTPFTYYILSILTLLVLLSFYAARAIARPIDRIVAELDRTDGVAAERDIEEKGTIEVVKLARALNGMRRRIRSMVDMRMRMLRSVSHDLRTPLTRLRLRAERLDEEPRRAMIADIDRIDALVAETLDYLRLDAQGEGEERVDITSLLRTIESDFADVGFDVRYEGPERVIGMCKPNSLARAVTNLCDNAVKFGRTAVVSLDRSDKIIRIDVADDGPGIPPEKRALVMEPFFKLDAARGAGSGRGFGLGLSIVADIVKAHGGTMEFHDRQPRGLIVRLLLPVR
ncbi:sensor histidine kinase [Aureimonas populi]|uniref:histidine kinase n=1 Tax=Aureimonas populi TaxID=1701758 RepID=A0ABW5CK03_9HYPH|nr:ATP-binding protein [Aureimonas populi]